MRHMVAIDVYVETVRLKLVEAQKLLANMSLIIQGYDEEVQLLRSALKTQTQALAWLTVEDDSFKTTGDEVLVAYKAAHNLCRMVVFARWDQKKGWVTRNGMRLGEWTVKHWMPLPGLPEEVEG